MKAPMWRTNSESIKDQTIYYPYLVKDKETERTELFMVKLSGVKKETLRGIIAVTQDRVVSVLGRETVILEGGKAVEVNVPKTKTVTKRLTDIFALFEFNLEINYIRAYREKDALRTEL